MTAAPTVILIGNAKQRKSRLFQLLTFIYTESLLRFLFRPINFGDNLMTAIYKLNHSFM